MQSVDRGLRDLILVLGYEGTSSTHVLQITTSLTRRSGSSKGPYRPWCFLGPWLVDWRRQRFELVIDECERKYCCVITLTVPRMRKTPSGHCRVRQDWSRIKLERPARMCCAKALSRIDTPHSCYGWLAVLSIWRKLIIVFLCAPCCAYVLVRILGDVLVFLPPSLPPRPTTL